MGLINIRIDSDNLRSEMGSYYDSEVVLLAWKTLIQYVVANCRVSSDNDDGVQDVGHFWGFVHDQYVVMLEERRFPAIISHDNVQCHPLAELFFKIVTYLYANYYTGLESVMRDVNTRQTIRGVHSVKIAPTTPHVVDVFINVQYLITQDATHESHYGCSF